MASKSYRSSVWVHPCVDIKKVTYASSHIFNIKKITRSFIKSCKCNFQSPHTIFGKFRRHFMCDNSSHGIMSNYFKNQIFSKSHRKLKILQYILEKCTYQFPGHFSTIWPNFSFLVAKQDLSMMLVQETLFPKIE